MNSVVCSPPDVKKKYPITFQMDMNGRDGACKGFLKHCFKNIQIIMFVSWCGSCCESWCKVVQALVREKCDERVGMREGMRAGMRAGMRSGVS